MDFVHQIPFNYDHHYSTYSRVQLAGQHGACDTQKQLICDIVHVVACIITMLKLLKHGYSNHTHYYNQLIAFTLLHSCA